MDDLDEYLASEDAHINLEVASDFNETDVAVTLGEIASVYEEEAIF